jgi:2-keto-4-pentenoate hydratase/2-oxohepta-3-ene-1,7-dioic acid hydratase in catechol pathway
MKLVKLKFEGKPCLGVIRGDLVVHLSLALDMMADRSLVKFRGGTARSKARHDFLAEGPIPESMTDLLSLSPARLAALGEILDGVVEFFHGDLKFDRLFAPLASSKFYAPMLSPGKIICVGRNYADHAKEGSNPVPTAPMLFLKSNNTVCAPGDPIVLPPVSEKVDYEAELAVVIGKGGKNIPEDKAYEHVAGYMCLNDVSARDIQKSDGQWFRGKSCDTFAPMGPWIVTKDEIPNPHGLRISLTLNGETMQDASTDSMIFKIPTLISYISRSITLECGDVISTGTPEGVGAHRTPPTFLKPGDTVSVTVEKIGTLTNPVAAG